MIDIDSRLKSLEMKNARLRMTTLALTGIVAVFVLIGAVPQNKTGDQPDRAKLFDELRAKRLVIVDDEGHERLVLEIAEKKFNNEIKSDDRKEVFATISIKDSEGVERASLDANDSGSARLKLFSKLGKRRIELVAGGDEYAKALVYDKNGARTEGSLP